MFYLLTINNAFIIYSKISIQYPTLVEKVTMKLLFSIMYFINNIFDTIRKLPQAHKYEIRLDICIINYAANFRLFSINKKNNSINKKNKNLMQTWLWMEL
jgi:hypothetical protein